MQPQQVLSSVTAETFGGFVVGAVFGFAFYKVGVNAKAAAAAASAAVVTGVILSAVWSLVFALVPEQWGLFDGLFDKYYHSVWPDWRYEFVNCCTDNICFFGFGRLIFLMTKKQSAENSKSQFRLLPAISLFTRRRLRTVIINCLLHMIVGAIVGWLFAYVDDIGVDQDASPVWCLFYGAVVGIACGLLRSRVDDLPITILRGSLRILGFATAASVLWGALATALPSEIWFSGRLTFEQGFPYGYPFAIQVFVVFFASAFIVLVCLSFAMDTLGLSFLCRPGSTSNNV